MTESEIRLQIVDVCRRLHARGMLAAADGNVSYRINDNRILFTPSGRAKAFIAADEIAVTDLGGSVHAGNPSGERAMHLEVYRRCPEARAVVHAHPPHAVAWSLARPSHSELPPDRLAEVILGVGRIPVVPYARATTEAMAEALVPHLPDHRVMILARHGGLSWGESLDEAAGGMERLEHSAQILWLAETLGGSAPLPPDEVEALRAMRRRIGDRSL